MVTLTQNQLSVQYAGFCHGGSHLVIYATHNNGRQNNKSYSIYNTFEEIMVMYMYAHPHVTVNTMG